jgi:hypothetical protein
MSGGWPISYAAGRIANQGDAFTSTSNPFPVTSGATAYTKGAWAQVVAATPFDAAGFFINGANNGSSTGFAMAIDVAIGPAGQEQVILSDWSCCTFHHAFFPLAIPAGSRIAERCGTKLGAGQYWASIVLVDGDFEQQAPLGVCTTYGFSEANYLGTAIDPGGTPNTKGAWSQIVAATTYDISAVVVVWDSQLAAGATGRGLIDLGIGPAGQEQVLIPNLFASLAGNNTVNPQLTEVMEVEIPAGSRLAMRAQSTNNALATRVFGATLYGFS